MRHEQEDTLDKYDEYRLHMEVLLSTPLIDLDVPMRILIPLEDAGIRRLRDLVSLSKKQLLSLNRMGVLSVRYLEELLTWLNLSFKKD